MSNVSNSSISWNRPQGFGSVPFVPEFKFGKVGQRTILRPLGITRPTSMMAHQFLSDELSRHIHQNIYHLKGAGYFKLIHRLAQARCNGCYIGHGDFVQGYNSVDWLLLRKQLRKKCVPPMLNPLLGLSHEVKIVRSGKRHRGLPQGASTSPMLYAFYLTPLLDRLNLRFNVLIYVDDFFWITRCRRKAKKFIPFLKHALQRHGYPGLPGLGAGRRIMQIHEGDEKQWKIYAPDEPMSVMGFELGGVPR